MTDDGWLHRLIAERELSRSESRAARVIADQPEVAVNLTITELAELAGVGEATVSRLCRALGFASFHALKIAIATHLQSPGSPSESGSAVTAEPARRRAAASQVALLIDETADLLDDASLERAVDAIAKARRTDIYGVGSSGLSAQDARARFAYLGLNCHAPLDHHFQIMAAASLKDTDVLLLVSASGSTRELLPLAQLARKAGATVIVLTAAPRSPLGRVADVRLLTGRLRKGPVGNLETKIVQLFAIELLASALSDRLGESAGHVETIIQDSLSDIVY